MVEFDIPIYGGKVKLYKSKDEYMSQREDLIDDEPDFDIDDFSGIVERIDLEDGSYYYAVGVFDGKVKTLVHELTHVAIFIAEHTVWAVNSTTSEPFCYLLETLFELSEPLLD